MVAAAAVVGGAGLVGSVVASQGAKSAANAQVRASQAAQAQQQKQFDQIQEQQQPFLDAGTKATGRLSDLLGTSGNTGADGYGSLSHSFDINDLKTNLAPNYQFQLDQGLGQARNQVNAAGGLIGGNALQGLNEFSQNFAKNAYQQAFDNYNTSQGNIYNRLAGLANIGTGSANQLATAGQANSTALGNLITGAGNAQAAGIVGSSNAIAGGLSSLGNIAGLAMMSGGGGAPSSGLGNYSGIYNTDTGSLGKLGGIKFNG